MTQKNWDNGVQPIPRPKGGAPTEPEKAEEAAATNENIQIDKHATTELNTSLLETLVSGGAISSERFKELVTRVDHLDVVAKVFLLEGTPFVFAKSPMKYMVFREQVADRFHVGYQDVCIVGSAKLGFSPAAHKYGKSFAEESDVDVVIISEELFDRGSQRVFDRLRNLGPSPRSVKGKENPQVEQSDWRAIKDGLRNYYFQNLNPTLLLDTDPLRNDIFERIRSTTPLFLALNPIVFVSKIRCRIFRNWKAAESYYTNTLRELRDHFAGQAIETDEDDEALGSPVALTG